MSVVGTVLVSFVVAVLAGLGVGGAGLLPLWLIVVCGEPQLTAQGANLAFFLFSSGASMLYHLERTPLLWGCAALLLPGGVAGSLLGAALAHALPAALLQKSFGVFLIFCGAAAIQRERRRANE